MKVSNEIRNIYADNKEVYSKLAIKVRDFLSAKKHERWHYEDRIKTLESYATKLETGRSSVNIDDFFACTLVVENLITRKKAEELIKSEFKLHSRRPRVDQYTHKQSDSFPFDDLRLYVSWIDSPGSKPSGLQDLVFEVQIKTFLQHAWSIATHDMIYKASTKNWAKERIAYQVKAMLEHAEVSILEADALSMSPALKKTNIETKRIKQIISLISNHWPLDALPKDLNRLAENVLLLISNVGVTPTELDEIIKHETSAGRGSLTINLSPFGSILQGIINHKTDLFCSYLSGDDKKYKIFITKDIDIPSGIVICGSNNIIQA